MLNNFTLSHKTKIQMNHLLCLSVLIFSLVTKTVHAETSEHQNKNTVKEGTPQKTLETALHKFKEVGRARLSILFWDIYDSRLLTPSGTYIHPEAMEHTFQKTAPAEPLLFEIRYLRKIKKTDLLTKTIEQWKYIGVPENVYKPYIPQLSNLWPDISINDTISLLINNEQSAFYYNNLYIGHIKHSDTENFGVLFLDIWLSPQTSQPQLRQKLLGVKK